MVSVSASRTIIDAYQRPDRFKGFNGAVREFATLQAVEDKYAYILSK